jgi:hypothetical protein
LQHVDPILPNSNMPGCTTHFQGLKFLLAPLARIVPLWTFIFDK